MKKKKFSLIRFLLRMDNFNRITVFISMVVFLIVPSIILFNVNASNYSIHAITACLSVLGMNIGIGLFTLYKPIRTTWFYFLACLVSLSCNCMTFLYYQDIPYMKEHNLPGIFSTEIVLASICLFINLIFFLRSFVRYRRNKSITSEKTNADSPFDFLNAAEINHDIEKQIRTMDSSNTMLSKIKGVKISRASRIFSFLALAFVMLLFAFRTPAKPGSDSFSLLFSTIVLSTAAFLSSLALPGDFKYIYYYVATFYCLMFILSASITGLSIPLCISVIVIHVFSLLLTLITEGRTWMGGPIDQ